MKTKIQLTTTSPKGQVVIPQEIREEVGIKPGTKFAVFGRKDVVVLKKIILPTINDFEKIVDFGTKFAKKKGIKPADILEED